MCYNYLDDPLTNNKHRNLNLCHLSSVTLDEPVLSPFRLEPTGWCLKSTDPALEIPVLAGGTGACEDTDAQWHSECLHLLLPRLFNFFSRNGGKQKWSDKEDK